MRMVDKEFDEISNEWWLGVFSLDLKEGEWN